MESDIVEAILLCVLFYLLIESCSDVLPTDILIYIEVIYIESSYFCADRISNNLLEPGHAVTDKLIVLIYSCKNRTVLIRKDSL